MPSGLAKNDVEQAPSEKSKSLESMVSPPQGVGAIRGIREKFTTNSVTGTGGMTVPSGTSAGRSGFGLRLSLAYDSGMALVRLGSAASHSSQDLQRITTVPRCRRGGHLSSLRRVRTVFQPDDSGRTRLSRTAR